MSDGALESRIDYDFCLLWFALLESQIQSANKMRYLLAWRISTALTGSVISSSHLVTSRLFSSYLVSHHLDWRQVALLVCGKNFLVLIASSETWLDHEPSLSLRLFAVMSKSCSSLVPFLTLLGPAASCSWVPRWWVHVWRSRSLSQTVSDMSRQVSSFFVTSRHTSLHHAIKW